MPLPEDFLQSLTGVPGFHREAFVRVHEEAPAPTSVRINPAKTAIGNRQSAMGNGQNEQAFLSRENKTADASLVHLPFPVADCSPVPWCATGYYLPRRPSFTFDPLFHAGCYYVQEASSMFLEQPLRQLLNLSKPLKVLDLCAAPGGKTTHLLSLLSPESLLVSNEVIKPRSLVLMDNVIRWGSANAIVTNNDPKAFQKLPGYFDAMVVDAPCSGSGLFRKEPEAIGEWSLHNVALCSQRQQRILADALPALKQGGVLIYSTCSYSKAEDEAIADWLVQEMEMENLPLNTQDFQGVVETASPKAGARGYRFYPDQIRGEGFFLSCFRKKTHKGAGKWRPVKPEVISAKEKGALTNWVADEGLAFVRFRESITALPQNLFDDFLLLQPLLNLQYAGVQTGEVMKDKLVPHHALAQSRIVKADIPATELSPEDAIKYLQRQDLSRLPETTGWQVARYAGHNLGWMNALKNRVNNYYPKEIRILKQQNNTPF